MKKARFGGLDCSAIVSQIHHSLIGAKLSNIYDGAIGKTSYLMKFGNANVASGSQEGFHVETKSFLFIEAGVRFHLSTVHTKSSTGVMPTPFVMKLRKHLNSKRLEGIIQLGKFDRVVDLRFGSGMEGCVHLILEFYAKGNIILTDAKYKIIALWRSHEYNITNGNSEIKQVDESKFLNNEETDGDIKVAVGEIYPVTFATTSDLFSQRILELKDKQITLLDMNSEGAFSWFQDQVYAFIQSSEKEPQNLGKKSKKKRKQKIDNGFSLRTALLLPSSGVHYYGSALIEHCILKAMLNPDLCLARCSPKEFRDEQNKERTDSVTIGISLDEISTLLQSLKECGKHIIDLVSNFSTDKSKGYIFYKSSISESIENKKENATHVCGFDDPSTSHQGNSQEQSNKIFLEFQPYILHQHAQSIDRGDFKVLTYPTFSHAVDTFYANIDQQKKSEKLRNLQNSAKNKVISIKKDQESRMKQLELEQEQMFVDATYVERYATDIDDCLTVINSALDSGMDWTDLEALVDVEKGKGNRIALLIDTLELEQETVLLKLGDCEDDEGERLVRINLEEKAHQNARTKYKLYRQLKEKAEKTEDANTKALAAAEVNAQKQLIDATKNAKGMAGMTVTNISVERKAFWFEKFNWFITSDNYLVLAGKDAHQNETLVKRYLRPGDAYLHADVVGASSCILRAKRVRVINPKYPSSGKKYSTKVLPLPDQALKEAGQFTICFSSAWSTKMITSAWYVESHQVSKTAPTGEYLTVGSFMVRGRKTYLQPAQLELGLGVLFRLGDVASISRHKEERRDMSLMGNNSEKTLMNAKSSNDDLKGDDLHENPDVPFQSILQTNNNVDVEFTPAVVRRDGEVVSDLEAKASEQKTLLKNQQQEKDRSKLSNASRQNYIDDKHGISDQLGTIELSNEAIGDIKTKLPIKTKQAFDDRNGTLGSPEGIEKAQAEKINELNSKTKRIKNKENSVLDEGKKLTRGKKNKLKKAARKYADQDEDDRKLAMLFLHGNKNEGDSKNKVKAKKKSSSNVAPVSKSNLQVKAAEETLSLLVKDTEKIAQNLPADVREIIISCISGNTKKEDEEAKKIISWDEFDADVIEKLVSMQSYEAQLAAVQRLQTLTNSSNVVNLAASLAGIIRTIQRYGYQQITNKEKNVMHDDSGESINEKLSGTKADEHFENEAWSKVLAENGILSDDDSDNDDESAIDDTSELMKLTGKPLQEDILLCCVPVCAPYFTLSKYKYRVKLAPGTLKRGKAANQCVDLLISGNAGKDDFEKRIKMLIKSVNHTEWVQVMCGDVKVVSPGASKTLKKQKNVKKKT